jgi:hypothetical protein
MSRDRGALQQSYISPSAVDQIFRQYRQNLCPFRSWLYLMITFFAMRGRPPLQREAHTTVEKESAGEVQEDEDAEYGKRLLLNRTLIQSNA